MVSKRTASSLEFAPEDPRRWSTGAGFPRLYKVLLLLPPVALGPHAPPPPPPLPAPLPTPIPSALSCCAKLFPSDRGRTRESLPAEDKRFPPPGAP